MKATFQYTGKWDAQKDKLNVRLYKTPKNQTGQTPTQRLWGTVTWDKTSGNWKLEPGGGFEDKVELVSIQGTDSETGGKGTLNITFKIKNQNESTGPSISREWDNGASYTIYAWNDKNTTSGEASRPEGVPKGAPGAATSIKVNPLPITQINGDLGGVTGEPKTIAPGESFSVSAEFKYDKNWYDDFRKEQAQVQYGGAKNDTSTDGQNGELGENNFEIALYKAPPNSNTFNHWGNKTGGVGGHTSKVTKPEIHENQETGTVTVTYTIKNLEQGDASIDWEYDDGSQYRILAWNDSNEKKENSGRDITAGNANNE